MAKKASELTDRGLWSIIVNYKRLNRTTMHMHAERQVRIDECETELTKRNGHAGRPY